MSLLKKIREAREAEAKLIKESNEVQPTADGQCPDGYVLSDDKTKCIAKESVKKEEGDSCAPNADGSCPDGYALSPDGKMCMKKDQESKAPQVEKIYDIGHNEPQFVVNGTMQVTLESGTVIQFEDCEAIEILENKNGHFQIGSSKDVLVITDPELASQLMNSVLHKNQIEVEERELSIEDAIKSDMSARAVADAIIAQLPKDGKSIKSMIEQNQGILKIRARRRIRSNSSMQMKAKEVRSESFYDTSSKPAVRSMKKIKVIRTSSLSAK